MLKKIVVVLIFVLWPLNLLLNFNEIKFSTETVFKNDYQAEQLILRNINLYPTVLFARVFQNKPRIYLTKFSENLFTLLDPNYYFFASHPEPLIGKLNFSKFPFLAIVFLFVSVFNLDKLKKYKLIFTFYLVAVLILSCFKSFEGFDFILWPPVSLIIVNGVNIFEKYNPKYYNYFALTFISFSITETVRSFFIY